MKSRPFHQFTKQRDARVPLQLKVDEHVVKKDQAAFILLMHPMFSSRIRIPYKKKTFQKQCTDTEL